MCKYSYFIILSLTFISATHPHLYADNKVNSTQQSSQLHQDKQTLEAQSIYPSLPAVPEETQQLPPAAQELINAALSENINLIKDALSKGANVNTKAEQGITALHIAANTGNKDIANILINHGAFINITDNKGYTPLDYAQSSHKEALIKLLKTKKAKRRANTKP